MKTTLLLVDDHHILYRSGTRRRALEAAREASNPIIAQDKLWESQIGYCSMHHDPGSGRWQMWYQAYTGLPKTPENMPLRCVICYAESSDGVQWHKPELELHPFGEHPRTNIVLLANGGHSDRYGCAVLHDERESDPSRRYKLLHADWTSDPDSRVFGLQAAFSPDGIHWSKHGEKPLLPMLHGAKGSPLPFADEEPGGVYPLSLSDVLDVIYDPRRGCYAVYSKMWIDAPAGGIAWKHVTGRSLSRDFLHWEAPQLLLTPDDDDPPWMEFHGSPAFFYEDCYFALLQPLNRHGNPEDEFGGYADVELAVSRDGENWQRPFRQNLFLRRSPGEQFDSGAFITNASPVMLGDEMRFYYGAYSGSIVNNPRGRASIRTGVGLARLTRDRFAGISACEGVGQITLKVMPVNGRQLTLNADASQGEVRVEALSPTGYRLRGFTCEEAVPITGDSLCHRILWNTNQPLPAVPVMLRLHLRGAACIFAVNLE